ncbi:hypothetical protein [Caldifermentibacillus hisashii]|uniref:hypothetical protein n=1 Tax=Caldifermentibacillus hisashii TaxID=996558 RepID=UPI0022B9C903|nr:hypothetical protein [Caldifermentibacillus hisashii]
MGFLGSKWRREQGSSPKTRLSDLKTATRKSLVAKKSSFLPKNSDEKESRRQKIEFSTPKRRREQGSSPKNQVFCPKIATRKGLVAKKGSFPAQNDDEKESRRQKIEFSTPKRRREKGSSPKKGVSRLKMTTRLGLVAKKWGFSAQNGDEKRARRQKREFPGSK